MRRNPITVRFVPTFDRFEVKSSVDGSIPVDVDTLESRLSLDWEQIQQTKRLPEIWHTFTHRYYFREE